MRAYVLVAIRAGMRAGMRVLTRTLGMLVMVVVARLSRFGVGRAGPTVSPALALIPKRRPYVGEGRGVGVGVGVGVGTRVQFIFIISANLFATRIA